MARDFGMLFVISHTAPLATILALISLPFQSPLMLAMGGAGLVLSYAGLALVGLALCALGGGVSATIASNLLLFLMHAMNSTVVNTVCNGGVLVASTLLSASASTRLAGPVTSTRKSASVKVQVMSSG